MEQLKELWQKVPLFWRLAGPGLLVILALAVLLRGQPDGRLHLYFFPVGQGNGLLVVSPSGKTVLVDGGPDASALLSHLGRQRPFWRRDLDLVVLTETTSERMPGPVAALERYQVHAAGRPGRVCPGEGWARWQALLDRAGVQAIPLQRGARLDLGDGVRIEVLHPGEVPLRGAAPGGRDDALVLRLSYGGLSALFPTAAGPAGQQALLDQGVPLSSTVLLIPQQAGEKALDPRFLQAVRPAVAVVSAGTGYQEGPDARTLAQVQAAGVVLYRTDRQGVVEIVTDGWEFWVKTER